MKHVKANSSVISSVAAGVGVIGTAYLAANASFKAARLIIANEEENGRAEDPKLRFKIRTRVVWKLYIPTGISAVSTIALIASANRFSAQKTAAAQAALAVAQRAYDGYRDQVAQEYSPRKDQSLRDKVVAEQIAGDPPPAIVAGSGDVMCCELFTMRYFKSDMETLRKAQNDLNDSLLKGDYCTMNEWYYLIGLRQTSISSHLGWRSDKLMELEFSAELYEGKPVIAFDYNYTTTL